MQLDPIYVTFNPSETDLAKIQKAAPGRGGRSMIDVLLPGETEAKHRGELTFIDNAVDRPDRHDHWRARRSATAISGCCPASMSACASI